MHLQKGFGLYSPHETTVLFLKATLVSIWVGLDLIALLVVANVPQGALHRHTGLLVLATAILAAGSALSILFAAVTGSLFGRADTIASQNRFDLVIQSLRSRPYYLLGAGLAAAGVILIAATPFLVGRSGVGDASYGRADLAIAEKCADVASREHSLFGTDERIVMTQCMLQYDRAYATIRTGAIAQK